MVVVVTSSSFSNISRRTSNNSSGSVSAIVVVFRGQTLCTVPLVISTLQKNLLWILFRNSFAARPEHP